MTAVAAALSLRPLRPPFQALPTGESLAALADATADFIYCDEVIETMGREDLTTVLREIARILKPKGVLRLAVSDLDAIVAAYLLDWRAESTQSRVQRLNSRFRPGSFLFNEEELASCLRAAGFTTIWRYLPCSSTEPLLTGLEPEGEPFRLILEARKFPKLP